jgi:hypothetical protein
MKGDRRGPARTGARESVEARLVSLAERTSDIGARRSLTERLGSIPASSRRDGFVASIARLALPSVAAAGAVSLALFVMDARVDTTVDDALASAVSLDVAP